MLCNLNAYFTNYAILLITLNRKLLFGVFLSHITTGFNGTIYHDISFQFTSCNFIDCHSISTTQIRDLFYRIRRKIFSSTKATFNQMTIELIQLGQYLCLLKSNHVIYALQRKHALFEQKR